LGIIIRKLNIIRNGWSICEERLHMQSLSCCTNINHSAQNIRDVRHKDISESFDEGHGILNRDVDNEDFARRRDESVFQNFNY
jgi:hypothetical protein